VIDLSTTLKSILGLKILVSVVRFRPWPPPSSLSRRAGREVQPLQPCGKKIIAAMLLHIATAATVELLIGSRS
jgi:hypothetical protein